MNSDNGSRFSEADRDRLIALCVDMGYMKTGIDKIGEDMKTAAQTTKSEVKALWLAIEDLRKFRWWLAGAVGGGSVVGGGLVKLLLH